MSQDKHGSLTEAEIIEHLSQYLGMRFDRDSLSRREAVDEIYTRFLDKIGIDWRNDDLSPILQKYTWLKKLFSLFSLYNNTVEFSINDIVRPNKKRTISFFNIILYILAELEDLSNKWQTMRIHLEEKQEAHDKLNQEIQVAKQRRDELAAIKGSSMSRDEYLKSIASIQLAFDTKQKEVDILQKEYEKIKEENSKLKHEHDERMGVCEEFQKKLDRMVTNKKSLEDQSKLEELIFNRERELEKLKLNAAIKENQLRGDLDKKKDEKRELIQSYNRKFNHIKTQIETIDRENVELEKQDKERSEKVRELLEKAHMKLKNFEDRFEESKKCEYKSIATLMEIRHKQDAFFGLAKGDTTEIPVNRTFIKSSANK